MSSRVTYSNTNPSESVASGSDTNNPNVKDTIVDRNQTSVTARRKKRAFDDCEKSAIESESHNFEDFSIEENPFEQSRTISDGEADKGSSPSSGNMARKKIKIEYIKDKSRRHITFTKRRAGIMKKAYELSTLTGTEILLLISSETGHVYSYSTEKFKPLVCSQEGQDVIKSCLEEDYPISSDIETLEELDNSLAQQNEFQTHLYPGDYDLP